MTEKMAWRQGTSDAQVDTRLKYAALDSPYQDVEFLCEYLTSQRSADFFKHFVILPRSLKSRGARLASYSSKLRDKMASLLNGNSQIGTLDDVVTQSNLFPDHTGWLVDQSSGRRRWCVIADMLLCVFETRQSERPLKVIMLPGHKVKAMVFSSAKQDTLNKVTCTYQERSEEQSLTITGVQRHQFAIYSPNSGERFMFGAETKEIIDKWVAMVTVATNLSQDLFTDSDEDSNTDSGYVPSSFSGSNAQSHSRESSPSLCSQEPKRKHCNSESDSGSDLRSNKSEPILPMRDSCRSRNRTRSSDSSVTGDDDKLAFSKVKRTTSFGSHNDLTTNEKKKLKSGKLSRSDDHVRNEKGAKKLLRTHSWSMGSQESLCSNGSELSASSTESKQSVESLSRFKALWTRNAVKTIDLNGKDNPDLCANATKSASRSAVTRSLEERIKSIPLPASIASALLTRRASADSINTDIKDSKKQRSRSPSGSFRIRMFSAKYKNADERVALSEHNEDDIKTSGWLHHKQLLKWSRIFCVVSKSYFYGYRSDYPSETPDLVLPLNECSVQLVENDKQRKLCFKICHLNAKSTYLAASDICQFSKWFSTLKEETKVWEDNCVLMKSQTSVDSLISRSSVDSSVSRSSMDSYQSNSSLSSTQSSNPSVCFGNVDRSANADLTTEDKNKNNAVLGNEEDADDDVTDGFTFVIGGKRGKTSKWQPPCPAHGLDTSSSSLNSSGLMYDPSMRRSASFTPSMSSCDCSLDLPDSPQHQDVFASGTSTGPLAHGPTSTDDIPSVNESDMASVTSSCSCMCSFPSDCVCCETQDPLLALPTKYASPSKYDANLKQVWKNDKNYQLQLLKSRVSALPDKPEIFNIHLPGPNNEGLLLVSDEQTETSHSLIQQGKSVSHKVHPSDRHGIKPVVELCGSDVVVAIPAREVTNPTISGYLDRQSPDGTWKSCWYVLKDSTLYRYNAPIDDTTENVVQLPGYTVKCSQVEPHTFMMNLEHQDFGSEVLRTENEAECSSWKQQLEAATRKHCVPTDENDNTDQMNEAGSEDGNDDLYKEIVQVKKEQLLREVLQQKQDIEKKRAHRTSQVDVASSKSSVSSLDSLHVPDMDTLTPMQSENVFKQVTYLKQRKFSTQLRVQSLQKQLQQLQEKGKEQQKGFKFGRRGNSVKWESKTVSRDVLERKPGNQVTPSGAEEDHIQQQLQSLTSELHVLDEHLDKMQRSAAVTIGLTTPELLTTLEKRRQFSKKKTNDSQKFSDSSSSEGDHDIIQNTDRKISKSSGLKLHKPNISGAFFKKSSVEKKSSNSSSQDCNRNGEDRLSPDSSLESNRRPSWEKPWRNSWDATKYPSICVNGENVTKSTSTLDIQSTSQDRLLNHTLDAKWKSKSYKALPTGAHDIQTKARNTQRGVHEHLHKPKSQVNSNSQNLHENIQSTRNEINPAALAEIAAFEELIREKMGTS